MSVITPKALGTLDRGICFVQRLARARCGHRTPGCCRALRDPGHVSGVDTTVCLFFIMFYIFSLYFGVL